MDGISLDSHESDPLQPQSEKDMDSYNNSHGQLATPDLLKSGKWTLKQIETMGLEELRSKKLRVIRPGLGIPKEPK